MAGDATALVQKVANSERNLGLMTLFQSLSREEQVALMEWARAICIKLSSFVEQQSLSEIGRTGQLDLPAPKPFIELALKVGAIRALTTDNTNLMEGCMRAFKDVLGDTKLREFEHFQEMVLLHLHLAKW